MGVYSVFSIFVQMQRLNRKRTQDWEQFTNPLGCILLVDWDPIRIFGYLGAMDEYDNYVGEIYDLLVADASQEEIVAHLRRIEVERMGVKGNPNMSLSAVAAKLRQAFGSAV